MSKTTALTPEDASLYEEAKKQLQSYHTLLHNVETPLNKWFLSDLIVTKECAGVLADVISEFVLKCLIVQQDGWAKRVVYDVHNDMALNVRVTDHRVFPEIRFTEASLDLLVYETTPKRDRVDKARIRLRALGDQLFALFLVAEDSNVDCPLFSWANLTSPYDKGEGDADSFFQEDWVSSMFRLCGENPAWVAFILPLIFEGWFKVLQKKRFESCTVFEASHTRLNAMLKVLVSHAKKDREDLLAPLIPFFVRYYEAMVDPSAALFSAMTSPLRLADRTRYLRLWAETMAYMVEEFEAIYNEGRQTSSSIREVPLRNFMTVYEDLWLTRLDLIAKVKPELDRLREVI